MSLESAVAFSSVLDVSLDWLLLGRGTIDSHKNVDERRTQSRSTYEALQKRMPMRIGDRSIMLLAQAIESIAEDVSGTNET